MSKYCLYLIGMTDGRAIIKVFAIGGPVEPENPMPGFRRDGLYPEGLMPAIFAPTWLLDAEAADENAAEAALEAKLDKLAAQNTAWAALRHKYLEGK